MNTIMNSALAQAMLKAGLLAMNGTSEPSYDKSQLDSLKESKPSWAKLKSCLTKPMIENVELGPNITQIQIETRKLFRDLGFSYKSKYADQVFVSTGMSVMPVDLFIKMFKFSDKNLQAVLTSCRKNVASISIINLEEI